MLLWSLLYLYRLQVGTQKQGLEAFWKGNERVLRVFHGAAPALAAVHAACRGAGELKDVVFVQSTPQKQNFDADPSGQVYGFKTALDDHFHPKKNL